MIFVFGRIISKSLNFGSLDFEWKSVKGQMVGTIYIFA